ncbi:7-carboxy-7-deazaguanine synthase QueE [Actinacidiphila sp. ITFR-21]|uniref:7-carboxy-7-deazaguanine synthase QueE n=1 Tax=Actinacidiphila sp. ITFR-21 TaxID=3075199 RepID=UPI00288A57B1|nr:7-carboxy-7-deazaguanine synthase QueE [Streptomyces sp. ITFR-21]WNI16404.1 7-carboxy-7-deazaguanine synthase QueE [Streptomyces sp. ITFR-21]
MRLGGCNLTCRWCDTPYTWDWQGTSDAGIAYDPREELHSRSVTSVADQVSALGVDLVVVSGGEPLGQQVRLVPLVELLTGRGMEVEIETNGTHVPHPALVAAGARFNVSPKLAHSGVAADRRIRPDALRSLAGTPGSCFKFVCRDPADLDEVGDLVRRFAIGPVWIMPEGQSAEHVSDHGRNLVAAVIERGWNLTTRLHILIWGQERGV